MTQEGGGNAAQALLARVELPAEVDMFLNDLAAWWEKQDKDEWRARFNRAVPDMLMLSCQSGTDFCAMSALHYWQTGEYRSTGAVVVLGGRGLPAEEEQRLLIANANDGHIVEWCRRTPALRTIAVRKRLLAILGLPEEGTP